MNGKISPRVTGMESSEISYTSQRTSRSRLIQASCHEHSPHRGASQPKRCPGRRGAGFANKLLRFATDKESAWRPAGTGPQAVF